MKIIIQDLAINYEDRGAGRVVLFLHGWKDMLHTFDRLFPVFTESRVVALDLPGFGESERPKGTWGLEDYVAFVKIFLAKIDAHPEVIIGHSFGGRIALKGIGSGQLKAVKLVLIATAGIARHTSLRSRALRLVAKIGRAVTALPPLARWRRPLRKKLYTSIGSDYFTAGAMKDIFLRAISEDLQTDARRISLPTLLLWGERDNQTPLEDGRRFATLIRGSTLKVFSGAGHFVHHERSADVAEAIKQFLTQ